MLASRATDSDPEVRTLVAAAWGRLANRAALPILRKSALDEKADVRIAAAVSLIKLGDQEGLPRLIAETKGSDSSASSPAEELRRMASDAARSRAVLRLGEVRSDATVEALKSCLSDASGEVRDSAAVALARLGLGGARQFAEAMNDSDEAVRTSAARSLGLIGHDGLEALKKAFSSDTSANVRAEAALAMGSFSDPASMGLLVAGLADKSGRVRLASARALALRDEPGSTLALKKMLDQSPAPEITLVICAALARRKEKIDLALLELTLGLRDPELKLLAVAALTSSDHAEAQSLLLKIMRTDTDGRVRATAAVGLVERLRGMSSGSKS